MLVYPLDDSCGLFLLTRESRTIENVSVILFLARVPIVKDDRARLKSLRSEIFHGDLTYREIASSCLSLRRLLFKEKLNSFFFFLCKRIQSAS